MSLRDERSLDSGMRVALLLSGIVVLFLAMTFCGAERKGREIIYID
jgi:hypothetical protein